MRATLITFLILGLAPAQSWADDDCKSYYRNGDDVQRYDDDAVSSIAGCKPGGVIPTDVDGIYWIDRPGKPVSEITRVFHVATCLGTRDVTRLPDRWLMCGGDARALNRAAYDAEVAKLKLTPERKAEFGPYFEATQEKIKTAQEWVGKRAGGPEYKKLMEVYDQAFKEWDGFYATNKAVIDAATAVEDRWWALASMKRHTPSELGCDDVRKGWRQWVAAHKFTSAKQVPEAVRSDELGTIVLRALALCDAAADRNVDAMVEVDLLEKGYTFRGPRMHATWVAMAALAKLVPAESPSMRPVDVSDVLWRLANDRGDWSVDRRDQPRQGKVAALKKTDGGVEVSFKKESWMEPDFECYDLPSRYWSQSDGHYKHDFACKKVGQHQQTSEEDPHIFSVAVAEGLKPGQVVTLRGGTNRAAKRVAFPIESRTPEKGGGKAAAKGKKAKDDQVKKGVELQTTGTLEVLYGVPLK
ncbi:MAG: hypothetical protein JWN44_3702 [Myxococcales bacterium]|nr:hypothetical protein [Myxococcales bacterium]